MKERGNDNKSSRILVLCCYKMAEDVQMLFFLERLKRKYPLRICMIPEETGTSQGMLEQEGWSTNLPERVLEEIDFVLLAGMPNKMIDSLENGLLEEPEVKLLTLCFTNRMQVYLWEENPWKESAFLPEPVQRLQEKKIKICDMYRIQFLRKQELEKMFGGMEKEQENPEKNTGIWESAANNEKHHMYTMEDVAAWDSRVIIPKGAYFTPLAADYIREKKICVEYQ